MHDLISRQAAIDAISEWGLIDGLSEGQAIEILGDEEKVPSVQPNLQPTCNQLATDYISRQVATDAVQGIGRLATLPDNDAVIRMSAVEYVLFNLPSAQPEPQWIPCSEHPDTDRNVFIARGKTDLLSCCIGHYDHNAKLWYEDRNWFAKIMYDAMYWCEMPSLPEPWRGEEHGTDI